MPNKVTYTFVLADRFSPVARRLSRTTERVRKKFSSLATTSKEAGRAVSASFLAMGAAANTALATGLGPLIAAFASLAAVRKFITTGADFEDSMADLRAITGLAGEDFAFLRNQALELGEKTKTASVDVAAGFKLVASAKSELLKDPKALSNITEQVLLLKNATGLELSEAAIIATEAMNQFELGADQAGRVVNTLAAGAKFGVAEVFDLGPALVNAGVAATLTNVKFEETVAALEVMAKGGLKGQRAGTGLQGALLKLDKALPKGIKGAGGLANALEILADANLTNTQLTTLFGLESIKAAGILVKNIPLLRQWTTEMTGTNVAQEQAAIRLGTLSAKVRGIGVAFSNVLIKAFTLLAPELEKQVQKFGKFVAAIQPEDIIAFAKGLKDVFRFFQAIGGVLAPLAPLLRLMLKVVSLPLRALAFVIESIVDKVQNAFALGSGLLSVAKKAGRLIGLGGDVDVKGATEVSATSRTQIDMNVVAPKGVVQGMKAASQGGELAFNVGVSNSGDL